jgi:hypothetical protein
VRGVGGWLRWEWELGWRGCRIGERGYSSCTDNGVGVDITHNAIVPLEFKGCEGKGALRGGALKHADGG